jgi:two-component system, chemotaxis family, protein-glutamate methylesterase/glutaminase
VGPQGAQWPIIALVGSTGGIDAFQRVLASLPASLNACVLALLHVMPERESALASILARASELEVGSASDGEALVPGRLLVAPPGQQMLIAPELTVVLVPSGDYPPSRPSADLLLTTLALAARDRAIAVVLSGHGHDGATGATVVHRMGGTVLASDQASSMAFSMPLATIERDSATDHVLDLDEIGPRLDSMVRAANSAA